MSNPIYVGLDDGHNNTCIVTSDVENSENKKFTMPSRAMSGEVQSFAIGSKEKKTFAYEADGQILTVGDINKTIETNFDEYPTSPMNRIIANHAMYSAGLGGKKVIVTSGLPIRQYYTYSKANSALIKNKKKNLLSSDVGGNIISKDNFLLPNVIKHSIIPEGFAAWIDYIATIKPDGSYEFDRNLVNEKIGIVDIGGRTTDIAVIKSWEVDAQRSSTIDSGMLDIHNHIRGQIKEAEGVDLDDEEIYRAVNENKVKIFGSMVDVTQVVNNAKSKVLNEILHQIKLKIGKGGDLSKIVFVGGGSIIFKDDIDGMFRHSELSHDPLYANARGMLKFSMIMSES